MGKALHSQIIRFFQERMAEHSAVERHVVLDHDTEYLYRIERRRGYADVVVHLSDTYRYGKAEYAGRPKELRRNSFILVAKPEGSFDQDLVDMAARDRIGIGQIGKLMGALSQKDVWKYRTPEEVPDSSRR